MRLKLTRRVARIVAFAAASLLVLAGCERPGFDPSAPVRDTHEQELRQARDALDRWAQAVAGAGEDQLYIPLREGTEVVGALDDGQKWALLSGAIVVSGRHLSPDLLTAGPAGADQAAIVWPDGGSLPVDALSATQVLFGMVAEGDQPCPDCEPLNVIGMAATTTGISTSRGPATAPAWRFTLAGTSAELVRVAVAETVGVWPAEPPWDATNPPAGRSIESAMVSTDDRHLRVGLTGAWAGADQRCGEDYTGEAVESDLAVVVVITVTTHEQVSEDPPAICNLIGYHRTAAVELAAPLGDRALLEVRQGLPVRVIGEPTARAD